jgi:hypothetical protein
MLLKTESLRFGASVLRGLRSGPVSLVDVYPAGSSFSSVIIVDGSSSVSSTFTVNRVVDGVRIASKARFSGLSFCRSSLSWKKWFGSGGSLYLNLL